MPMLIIELTIENGGLFQSPFKRSLINGDDHLQQAIIYVHANAKKYGLIKDFRMYAHSSYHEILSNTFLISFQSFQSRSKRQSIKLIHRFRYHEDSGFYYFINNFH